MEMLRKITISTVGLDKTAIKAAVTDGKGKAQLVRIVGVVSGSKAGQTDKGEFLALIGEFSAVNLQTGEQFQSGKCILPNFISDQFAGVLNAHGSAEFALEIGARENKTSVTGYEFTVKPLMESKSSNRMAELIAIASKDVPALPAPSAPKAKKTPKK